AVVGIGRGPGRDLLFRLVLLVVVRAEDVDGRRIERRAGREVAPVGAAGRLLPLGDRRQAPALLLAVGAAVAPGDEDHRMVAMGFQIIGVVPVRGQLARPAARADRAVLEEGLVFAV